jgi:hypothetical protein
VWGSTEQSKSSHGVRGSNRQAWESGTDTTLLSDGWSSETSAQKGSRGVLRPCDDNSCSDAAFPTVACVRCCKLIGRAPGVGPLPAAAWGAAIPPCSLRACLTATLSMASKQGETPRQSNTPELAAAGRPATFLAEFQTLPLADDNDGHSSLVELMPVALLETLGHGCELPRPRSYPG